MKPSVYVKVTSFLIGLFICMLLVSNANALPQDVGGCYWERVQMCPPLSGICHYSEEFRCP